MNLKIKAFAALLGLLIFALPLNTQGQGLSEASGIVRLNSELLIVGDDNDSFYYRYPVPSTGQRWFRIEPTSIASIDTGQKLAIDLEAVDVLADGRIVLLSEQSRALVGERTVIVVYDDLLSEFGNRGLEGLAIRPIADAASRVAVLWEGGYPEFGKVTELLQWTSGRKSMRPIIWVHDLISGKPDTGAPSIAMNLIQGERYNLEVIELEVRADGEEPMAQRFRAPDLVWCRLDNDNWGFLVLLSSQNSPPYRRPDYKHTWLQRFNSKGKPVDGHIDLKADIQTLVKKKVHAKKLSRANWEGMGWYEDGKSVVLIHDKPPPGTPTAVIIDIPEGWCQ